ncbi:hypothetical protein VIOR103205_08990 [Vibrio ordalii]
MRNTLFFILIILLSGCSNNPDNNLDVENSPCACVYFGSPLITTPTDSDLKEIADLQFWRVS